jgi:tRNA 2-thiouridine synthesizing protein A
MAEQEKITLNLKPDITIDCVGLYCPMPIVNTTKQIKTMQPGQVLEVVADDEGIKQDMPSWAKMTGNEFLGIEEERGKYHVFVRKA